MELVENDFLNIVDDAFTTQDLRIAQKKAPIQYRLHN